MPNYTKVQFLAWEIYTGPLHDDYLHVTGYPGISFRFPKSWYWEALSQCLDIEARLVVTQRAIEKAYEHADKDENTLKIFMAPEFLYRGAAGAYFFDLLSGWEGPAPFHESLSPTFQPYWKDSLPPPFREHWRGLLPGLQSLVNDDRYKDWLFIFGTAIGGAFARKQGQWTDGIANNIAFVQRGGAGRGAECCYTQKHLKSSIDFIDYNTRYPDLLAFFKSNTHHDSPKDWEILDRLIMEDNEKADWARVGGALFRFPDICKSDGTPIQFGLEICLDHKKGYASQSTSEKITGRLAKRGEFVDIQLVPSCGTHLIPTSLALGPEEGPRNCSYAFNCDGLRSLPQYNKKTKKYHKALGGHVQLWNELPDSTGSYAMNSVSETPDSFLDPDQSAQPDDPTKSMHFAVDGADIDLSKRVPMEEKLRKEFPIDLRHISPKTLWRSRKDFGRGPDAHMRQWPMGPGFIRRLPAVPLAAPADEEA